MSQIPWLVEFVTWLWKPAFLNSSAMNVLGRLAAVTGCGQRVAGSEIDGRKPPSNQPQETSAVLSSSPMLVPLIATASRVEQSSQ